jgi:hypothetical protein
VTVTGGTLANFSGSGFTYTAIFTPTPNSILSGTVSVAAATFTDAAGNDNTAGTLSPAITIDTIPLQLLSFSSPVANGTYSSGAEIPVMATLSEAVPAGAAILVTLNTGATVQLSAAAEGNLLIGTYVVAVGQVSKKLDVVAYQTIGNVADLAGNQLAGTVLPVGQGQLAAQRSLVINGTIKISVSSTLSTNPASIPDRKGAVTAVPIKFSTPVTGVSLSAIRLFFNGRSISLRGATLTGSGANYVVKLPASLTTAKGLYTMRILSGSAIRAVSNSTPLTQALEIYWGNGRSVTPPARVAGR